MSHHPQTVLMNRHVYRDKVYACWLGKNIGGTMGAPFEGHVEYLDVKGYTTPKGEPLPNDDLDLQLVWLRALEELGPAAPDSNHLAWYWMRYIYPNWNEYGISKNNLKVGFLPPMSGEYGNAAWKNSNGAWIRSEIWACLTPGCPDAAARYAVMDASVDHGLGEGTPAEVFTATLESLAFTGIPLREAIEKALAYVPPHSRLAENIRLVLDAYDRGTPWRQVREQVVEANADWGWFQAPGNVAFAVIGLLYGEGDFLKSLLCAINCGDDTDCTAATVGAIMGIHLGTAGIPEDLRGYIGDRIVTMSIDRSSDWPQVIPATCTELAERVIALMPAVLKSYGITLGEAESGGDTPLYPAGAPVLPSYVPALREFLGGTPYSYTVSNHSLRATVNYLGEPSLGPGESLRIRVDFVNPEYEPQWLTLRVHLPEGWTADYRTSLCLLHQSQSSSGPDGLGYTSGKASWELTLTAGERREAVTRIPVTVEVSGYPEMLCVPITVVG